MKIILPNFTGLLIAAVLSVAQSVAAQPPAAASTGGTVAADPEALVKQMAETLLGQRSISARIRLHANLFGNQMIGAGVYLQQGLGADRQLRLEIKMPVGERTATLQQVCDSNFLWQFQDLSDKPILTRIDIHRVQQGLERAGGAPSPTPLAAATLGGVPQLVDSLRQSFKFNRAEGSKLDTLPIWIIHGTWKPAALAPLSPELAQQASEGKPLDLKKLPPQMPEEVVLFVGQDDLFPYHMEYRRRKTKAGKGDAEGEAAPILIVELYEVRLNSPIDPQQFVYQPGSAEVLDTTDQVLKSLGVK